MEDAGLDEDLVPGLVEAGTVDGKLYGMPWYAGIRSVVYRTDVFEKAASSRRRPGTSCVDGRATSSRPPSPT